MEEFSVRNGNDGDNNEEEEVMVADPNELRLAGNARFAANALEEALAFYSLAVENARKIYNQDNKNEDEEDDKNEEENEGKSEVAKHLCNRSACLYRMEMFEEAKEDGLEAWALCRSSKAAYRLARAQLALQEHAAAVATLSAALQPLQHAADDEARQQKRELEKLLVAARRPSKPAAAKFDLSQVRCVASEPRTPSIKEFLRPSVTEPAQEEGAPLRLLGEGNFSSVVSCQHRTTHERFALKIINKDACHKLAKRQHPNVYNEVQMERRVITRRLPPHPNILKCFHAMEDYGNVYFLLQLHALDSRQPYHANDLWGQIRHRFSPTEPPKMTGCHPSLIPTYLYELLNALDHCHRHGIVHRDLKPENVLLDAHGHVVLIDFGTAKDLIHADLNGPEFVGTPDFMSPEAVRETTPNHNHQNNHTEHTSHGADFTADLWALGVLLYQLFAGALPFEAASPYMTFLKIQRGVFPYTTSIHQHAWDLISRLLKVNPNERIGAGTFQWIPPKQQQKQQQLDNTSRNINVQHDTQTNDSFPNDKLTNKKNLTLGKVIHHNNGYDVIRQHPFIVNNLHKIHSNTQPNDTNIIQPNHSQPIRLIPSLRDLSVRATVQFIYESSLDINLEESHPPGDNSKYDPLRLQPHDRHAVMHQLDRFGYLKEPRVFRRFFQSKVTSRLGRVRPQCRNVVGLTQINDKMGQIPGAGEDAPHPDQRAPEFTRTETDIHHITNPLFWKDITMQEMQRKQYLKQLKESIRLVNRLRPKLVVITGYLDESCQKIVSKINETVPLVVVDDKGTFSFWIYGAHCIAVPMKDFTKQTEEQGDAHAMAWLRMELEQIKTARRHGYIFVDGDPRDIPKEWMEKIGKSNVLAVMGMKRPKDGDDDDDDDDDQFELLHTFDNYTSNSMETNMETNLEDDISTSSSDSDMEKMKEEYVLRIIGRRDNGVRSIVVTEEETQWESQILL